MSMTSLRLSRFFIVLFLLSPYEVFLVAREIYFTSSFIAALSSRVPLQWKSFHSGIVALIADNRLNCSVVYEDFNTWVPPQNTISVSVVSDNIKPLAWELLNALKNEKWCVLDLSEWESKRRLRIVCDRRARDMIILLKPIHQPKSK